VPTTYAGSEATPILGQTEGGRKTTLRDLRVVPNVIVYDVALTLTLPVALSATSGINAIAHAVEALYAQDTNPVTTGLAEQGIGALARALPRIVADARDVAARADALFGAWTCGTVLGQVGMALHHKLCHVLGGTFDLPHAETHTVVLPYAAAYNAAAAPEAMARVARLLGAETAPEGLRALAAALGTPTALRDLGMPEDGIDRAADLAVADPYWNPRPLEREALRDLLAHAHAGRWPLRA
jgi:alcohol dehydrogenase class IV